MRNVATAGLVPTSARSLPPLLLHQPRSVAEVLAALRNSAQPVLLAGGTDLVAAFNEGLPVRELVSLAGVAELKDVHVSATEIHIGAGVCHAAGSSHAALRERLPGLAQAWARIANPRIRFHATLGGNLMALRPRYEASLLLSAARAKLVFAAQGGTVVLSPAQLWQGLAPPLALLTHIVLPTQGLLAFVHERSLRPLLTLAAALRQGTQGLVLNCAVATEYLPPMLLELELPGLHREDLAHQATRIADAVFALLPADFQDAVVTPHYARSAGAALLARTLPKMAGEAHV